MTKNHPAKQDCPALGYTVQTLILHFCFNPIFCILQELLHGILHGLEFKLFLFIIIFPLGMDWML